MHVGSDQHLAEELLEKYAMRKLEEDHVPGLEEHLLVCSECQLRLADMDDYVTAVRAAARELDKPKLPRENFVELLARRFWQVPKPVWAGALAAAMLIATVIPFVHRTASDTNVDLSALRGSETVTSAHGNLVLRIDLATVTPLTRYELQVVDSNGTEQWHSAVVPQNGHIVASLPKQLNSGRYWVRLYSQADRAQPLQEFALQVN